MLKTSKKSSYSLVNGFFFYFGFMENPAEKQVMKMFRQSSGEKIRLDLKKINADYRKSLNELKSEIQEFVY